MGVNGIIISNITGLKDITKFKKKRENMKESRLFQILYYILERGRVTARELADEFEVSVRTVYRDIDWISNVGIPIYTTQGKGGGIEIDRSFVLDRSILTSQEKEQILIALSNTRNISELEQKDLISKLSILFKVKNTNWIEIDSSNWTHSDLYQKLFEDIKFSIMNKKIISFYYSSNQLETTERLVKPIRLVFKAWSWYLYGFCNLRKDFRFFKLSRITNYNITDEVYREDYSDIVIKKEITSQKTVKAKLKFNKSQAFKVYDDFYDNVVENGEYLFVELELPVDYLYNYILSFGAEVEVLAPEEVRIKIKTLLEKTIKKYIT